MLSPVSETLRANTPFKPRFLGYNLKLRTLGSYEGAKGRGGLMTRPLSPVIQHCSYSALQVSDSLPSFDCGSLSSNYRLKQTF